MIYSDVAAAGPSSPDVAGAGVTWGPPSLAPRVAAEVRATVTGEAAEGEGPTFRLRPRWPSADQLDYVNKAATAGLLVIGLLLLVTYAARNPAGAVGVLARGAAARAGVR